VTAGGEPAAGSEPDADGGALRLAYEARSRQLLEARAALAESAEQLAAVTTERDSLRAERDSLRAERDSLRAERDSLQAERDALRVQLERERIEFATVRDSKLMRWSAPLRRAVYRLRARR
jgi:chromosome segregation ATPase